MFLYGRNGLVVYSIISEALKFTEMYNIVSRWGIVLSIKILSLFILEIMSLLTILRKTQGISVVLNAQTT